MPVEKKLVAYHIARLQDKSAEVRLKSIAELVELGDEEALDALKSVYERDVNPEVRAAAKNAGRVIFTRAAQRKQAKE